MAIESIINNILSTVCDRLTQLTPIELGLKTDIQHEGNNLSIHFLAGFPCQSLTDTLLPALKEAIAVALPQLQIQLSIEHFIQAHRTQLAGKGLRGIKNTIAIASGKGGVGKSTVTVHLATCLAQQGARVGILDADIYGPSIPTMLGHKAPVEISGEQYLPAMAHGVQSMSIGYLTNEDDALIWRGPMLAKVLIQMIELTQWDNLDYLFIDLPPGTGDIQLSLVQKIPLTGAVIVTTPQTVATQDAQKALAMFKKTNIDVLGVVENMSIHTCSQCGHQEALFGHGGASTLCATHNTLLLGQLPLDPNITAQCDQGKPLSLETQTAASQAFLKMALNTSIELAKRPLNYATKFPPIVVE